MTKDFAEFSKIVTDIMGKDVDVNIIDRPTLGLLRYVINHNNYFNENHTRIVITKHLGDFVVFDDVLEYDIWNVEISNNYIKTHNFNLDTFDVDVLKDLIGKIM